MLKRGMFFEVIDWSEDQAHRGSGNSQAAILWPLPDFLHSI
jgi:hypothetical protein